MHEIVKTGQFVIFFNHLRGTAGLSYWRSHSRSLCRPCGRSPKTHPAGSPRGSAPLGSSLVSWHAPPTIANATNQCSNAWRATAGRSATENQEKKVMKGGVGTGRGNLGHGAHAVRHTKRRGVRQLLHRKFDPLISNTTEYMDYHTMEHGHTRDMACLMCVFA